jgi:ribosome-associated protein
MTTTDTAAKKDVQKLQRIIVDALEDVKAQAISVFNTEHLSSLFERVIIASGTSNRQTKALAASVRDAVRDAGFVKPRSEGEENGEWIIVDCGAVVAHIMQPAIRQYYNLEEIWGDKPVRLKFGATKPAVAAPAPVVSKSAPVKTSLRRSSAVKTAERDAKQAAEKAAQEAARPAGRKRPASGGGGLKTATKMIETARAKPSARPAVKAATAAPAKVATKAAPKAVTKVATKPVTKPVTKAVTKAAAKPTTKPAPRPAAKTAATPAATPPTKVVVKAPAKKPAASAKAARPPARKVAAKKSA